MAELILLLKKVSEIKGAKNIVDFFTDETDHAISFATGSLLKPAFIKLNQSEIKYDVELVVGSNEIYEREEIVEKEIERAKDFHRVNSFDHIILVGDGIWVLKTAQNLGLHFVGIGMKNYADFEKENIKVPIKDWSEFDLDLTEQKLGIKNTITNTRGR